MTPFVKLFTRLLGITLLIAGIAGFFVGDTLLVFEVDPIHNIVHVLTGVLALGAANSYGMARNFLLAFGFIYTIVGIVGFMSGGDIFGLFHTNTAGHGLHIGIGVACLFFAFTSKKKLG